MDVITLGETMVLLTPETIGPMRYASTFTAKVAGAETNVAIGLARLGHQVGWLSRLGKDEFGKKILAFIRGEGVDISRVTFDPQASTGLYFKELITEEEIAVHYYRKDSAASHLSPNDLDEAYIASATYLHLTGITPALSDSCRDTVFAAIDWAKRSGVTVVFDPNLRRKLWSDQKAKETLLAISAQADILLPGLDEAHFLFGELETEQLVERFQEQGAKRVILKLGAKGAYYKTEDESGYVEGFPVRKVLDPVGAGDGFAAGLLSGLLDQLPFKEAVKRAAAVGALVTMVPGDVEGLPDRERMEAFINHQQHADVNR
ncbi:2-dehydro-3-deoxygluconokinase [Pullulanibacillus camelliae]|uniref:2-dehydro-3-deoxygluconokinase n=1 Tax=Pullulanibacillus camelliae TaxID=1707096 RepID=A0A8J2YI74_9BACL|nr:sugar kinase [Pullulanibacillus camelliae]GGE44367.1 2-dehydro-3-deoxygluconokinase [Pullulanibacillus camelliae]